MPTHFKSMDAYRKSMAFIAIHHIPHEHHKFVYIAGHKHMKG